MTSRLIARASAIILGAAGAALLFAADEILPRLDADGSLGRGDAWIGQLLGASWLGLAAINWLSRNSVLGGIYGRPVVLANAALYFVSAMVLLQAEAGPARWTAFGIAAVMAAAYGRLMFGGPIDTP